MKLNLARNKSKVKIKTHDNKALMLQIKNQKELFFMVIPWMIFTFIFCYLPLTGWVMAFQNFKPAKGYFGSPFVGMEQFKFLLTDSEFWMAIRNTLAMSTMNLVFGLVFSVGFALLINEVRWTKFKKSVQSISYLPHFLSWVIVCSLISNVLSTSDGMLNNMLMSIGLIDKPILWLGEEKYFWWIVAFGNVWKEMGWNSIIYLAAISGIDQSLYEAAAIDGANRYQKMLYITLPSIKPTIIVITIMNLGWILNAGFEVQYLLGDGLLQDVSQTIDIFVLKYGINIGNYSLATAAGIFKTVVSIIMIAGANMVIKKSGEEGVF